MIFFYNNNMHISAANYCYHEPRLLSRSLNRPAYFTVDNIIKYVTGRGLFRSRLPCLLESLLKVSINYYKGVRVVTNTWKKHNITSINRATSSFIWSNVSGHRANISPIFSLLQLCFWSLPTTPGACTQCYYYYCGVRGASSVVTDWPGAQFSQI